MLKTNFGENLHTQIHTNVGVGTGEGGPGGEEEHLSPIQSRDWSGKRAHARAEISWWGVCGLCKVAKSWSRSKSLYCENPKCSASASADAYKFPFLPVSSVLTAAVITCSYSFLFTHHEQP